MGRNQIANDWTCFVEHKTLQPFSLTCKCGFVVEFWLHRPEVWGSVPSITGGNFNSFKISPANCHLAKTSIRKNVYYVSQLWFVNNLVLLFGKQECFLITTQIKFFKNYNGLFSFSLFVFVNI